MEKHELLDQLLFKAQVQEELGISKQALQYHLDQGNIRPCKEHGEGRSKVQLFWREDVEKLKNDSVTQASDEEIKEFYESVGFLFGGLLRYYKDLMKSSVYDNLMQPINLKNSQNVYKRLWPLIEGSLFINLSFSDEIGKRHLHNLNAIQFKIPVKKVKDINATFLIFNKIADGEDHFFNHTYKR